MIRALIRLYWRPLTVATVLLALAAGIGWWGHVREQAGYDRAQAEAETKRLQIQEAMQYEVDRESAKARGAALARDAALGDLSTVRGQLDRMLADASHAKAAGASSGSDGPGADWVGGFSACYSEYAELAGDAAKWADTVNGLQGFVRAIRSKSPG